MESDMRIRKVLKTIEIRQQTGPFSLPSMGKDTAVIEINEPVIIYTKKLAVVGGEPLADTAPIFVVYIEIASEEEDMEKVLPIMVAAVMQNVGKNTDGTQKIRASDPDVVFIISK